MTKIKTLMKAYGCAGDNYDRKEIKLEKILNKDLSDNHLTETDLKQILETMIVSVKEIKSLYPDEQTNVIRHNDNRLESIKFEITFGDKSEPSTILEEKLFFKQVAKHNNLASLILSYCKVTDDGEEGTRVWITNEYDEGPPAGTYAVLALVDKNKKWIPDYIAFLRTNDLDHEVEQMWDIKTIIEKYGWCKETYELAIARNVSCCGQGGKEQFERLIKDGLKESLNNNKNRKLFLDNILKEFQEWKDFKFRIKDGSKDSYLKYIVSYAKHFEKLLTKSDINKIEATLLQKWNEYNN